LKNKNAQNNNQNSNKANQGFQAEAAQIMTTIP
jgi:hypothetical protein